MVTQIAISFGTLLGQRVFRVMSTGTTIFVADARGRDTLSSSSRRGTRKIAALRREDRRAQFTKP